jgi:hypothetical protein
MSCSSSGSSSNTAAVHGLGGTAEVEVDAGGSQGRQHRGVLGQAGRVGPQQLRPHRHARRGAPAVQQFRHHAGKDPFGQHLVRDADELGDAAVDATGAGEDVAQAEIEQPFHRGE